MKTPKCSKCGGTMETGLIEDYYSPLDPHPSQWATKSQTEVRVLGLTLTKTPNVRFPVTTYRCSKCGFLESYALPKEEQQR